MTMHDCSKTYFKLPPEQQAIRDKCFHPAGNFIEFKKQDIEQSISMRFEEIVRAYPSRLAVKTKSQALTYQALNQIANRVARTIIAMRGTGNEPIALLLDQGVSLIAAILGGLKSGKIYVSLEPFQASARNGYILEDTETRLIVTNNRNFSEAKNLARNGCHILNIDEIDTSLSTENMDCSLPPDALASIMYTSGSTGRPKGVVQNHRNVLQSCKSYTNGFHISMEDRLTLLHSCSFNGSAYNLFGALLNGAALFPLDVREEGVHQLVNWLGQNEISIYHSSPTTFRHALQDFSGGARISNLRIIHLSGAAVSNVDVELYRNYCSPNCILVHRMGVTETGTIRWYFIDKTTPMGGSRVPIGYPADHKQTLILDDSGEQIRDNRAGEIAIESRYLSLGYWRKPHLTQAKFLPDPNGGDRRIYLTGDLGRMAPDGCLLHLGRNDYRVKVRGFSVGVGEIESALLEHRGIHDAVVVGWESPFGDKRLVAYLVQDERRVATVTELRDFLHDRLPDYMIPSSFVTLSELPLTPNGKVDRTALPAPGDTRPNLATPFAEPRTSIEGELARIWAGILSLDRVGIDDNFFDLGGHSLAATRVVSQVITRFQFELPLQSLFESPTVAEIAAVITKHQKRTLINAVGAISGAPACSLQPIPRDRELPLSFAQQRLWFFNQLDPDSPVYNQCKTLRLRGRLNREALQQALDTIVARHEVLRTTFSSFEGKPTQVIHKPGNVELRAIDLGGIPTEQREETLHRTLQDFTHQPFDLETDWPLRAALIQRADEEHVIVLVTHHIASDGWSNDILFRELSALYEAYCQGQVFPLTDMPIQYADYALWQRKWLQGEVLQQEASYWKKQLEDISPLELLTDHPRPAVLGHRGHTKTFTFPPALAESLKNLSRQEGVTLFMTLLAAFQTLLHRYTAQDDIAIGSPIAGRNRVEVEGLIGFFVNTLVLRNDFSGRPTFLELLQRVKNNAVDAYSHQDVPFEKLVEEIRPERDLGHNPFFQVNFQLRNYPTPAVSLGQLNIEEYEFVNDIAKFDLSVALRDDVTGLRGSVEYNIDLFEAATIERMFGHFQTLLDGIVANPEQPISDLPLLTGREKHQLLVECNGTKTDYPKDKFIHQLFEEQAERTPEAVAVVFEDQQVTYQELNHRTNQLARYLQKLGVGPEVLVGICVDRSIEMVVGLLGILKAGGAYVPLDPDFPKERLDFMLQDAQVRVLLTQEKLLSKIDHRTAVCLDSDWLKIAAESTDNPQSQVTAGNLVYVIYTSGSTGTPKGVAVEHRQLNNYLSGIMDRLDLGSQRSFATVSTLAADLGNTVIYSSLCTGAALHVMSQDRGTDAEAMADYFSRHTIDCLKIVPSHLAALQSASRPEAVLPRKLLILGGEASDIDWVKRLTSLAPDCRIVNHYGPTETTIGVMTYAVQKDALSLGLTHLPLGRPLANTQIYILDQRLNPAPIGVPGEIYIGGQGLARGYLNRPGLTQEKFVANPFSTEPGARLYKTGDRARYLADGNVEFLGRIDNQVKLRGYRIEPGEIEATLKQHPDLREAVVLARPGANGEKQLAAYVVATPARAPLIAGKPRYRLPNGIAVAQLNKNETDYIYQEIFERQAYLKHGITIHDDDCIFDVGANIGLFTLFAHQIARHPKLYSFEPNPAVFEILKANAKLAGSEVRLFNCGLADRAGDTTFTFFPGFSLLSGFHADAQAEKQVVKTFMLNQQKAGVGDMTQLVEQADAILEERFAAQTFSAELSTLSSIIEQEGIESIDLLKINVEKSELDVLNGIKDQDWPKIKQIVLEVDVKENLPTITALLEKQGYEHVVEQDSLLEGTSLCYVYAIRPGLDRCLIRERSTGTNIQAVPVRDHPLLSAAELRAFLAAKLPEHMIPSAYLFFDTLPLTANGKLDRQALAALVQSEIDSQDRFEAPRSPVEELLVQIWSDVLKVDKVGIHDNFFHLGGHSLLATQIVSRIRHSLKHHLPLRTLFEAPTIHGLAQNLKDLRDKQEVAQTAQIAPVVRAQYLIQRTNFQD